MKRFTCFVILLALLVGMIPAAVPVAAQNGGDCDIQLAAAIGLLAQAQAMADAGDTTAALDLLAQAQAEIGRIRVDCGVTPGYEDAPPPEEAAADPNRTRIVVWAYGNPYFRLEELAQANGIALEVLGGEAFAAALQEPDVAGAIDFNPFMDGQRLSTYAEFLEGGGRMMLFHSDRWPQHNRLLETLYSVQVIDQDAGRQSVTFLYDDRMLPSWLDGWTIGEVYPNDRALLHTDAFLIPLTTDGDVGMATTVDSEREEVIITSTENLLLWPTLRYRIPNVETGFAPSWLADQYIDTFDNADAALQVLNFLLGRVSITPGVASRPGGVTDAHVAQVEAIQQQVANGAITVEQAEQSLLDLAAEVGQDGLAWLVSVIPVVVDGEVVSFGDYAGAEAAAAGVDPDSRLGQDPIGTALDLLFGEPSADDMLDWLGFGE